MFSGSRSFLVESTKKLLPLSIAAHGKTAMEGQHQSDRFNPNEWVPAIMALGTWLFAMYQAYKGIHYVPDEWVLAIVLSPYGSTLYSKVREQIGGVIKRLPKKD